MVKAKWNGVWTVLVVFVCFECCIREMDRKKHPLLRFFVDVVMIIHVFACANILTFYSQCGGNFDP